MADVIDFTPKGVPIAGWMIQANPALSAVSQQLAESEEVDDWVWSCHPTYRAGLIDEGHPCFFWITQNDNPDLASGIWLVGKATGPCEDGPAWDSEDPGHVQPYAQMRLATLRKPIRREDLLAHPILKDLEILRVPSMSNPQIVTPEQFDALRQDFDLTVGPLTEELRDALWQEDDIPELWVAGPNESDVTVFRDESGYAVYVDDEVVSHYQTWNAAVSDACSRVDPELPPSDDEEPDGAAGFVGEGGMVLIARTGPNEYRAYLIPDDEPDVYYSIEGSFESLERAVLEVGGVDEE